VYFVLKHRFINADKTGLKKYPPQVLGRPTLLWEGGCYICGISGRDFWVHTIHSSSGPAARQSIVGNTASFDV